MKVHLYSRDIKDKTQKSLYLQITGLSKKAIRENLGLYLYSRPKDQLERNHNTETRVLAETRKSKRQIELQAVIGGETPQFKKELDFITYFEDYNKNYRNADYKKIKAAYTHFTTFCTERKINALPGKGLSLTLCEDFAEYLKRGLKGETPKAYFRVFKTVLIRARKEGLTNLLTQDIKVSFKNDTAIKKPLLSSAEVKLLEQTDCPNKEIKRAVLFSLNTGFDFATVSRVLKWEHLDGNSIIFDRSKTDSQNRFPLNAKALALLGTPGKKKELIFSLPTWEGTVKAIRAWAKEAGIHKKLTYHSLRHSFGYILRNEHGVDIGTLGDLLGHKDIKTTKRYEHLDESTKRAAVDKL